MNKIIFILILIFITALPTASVNAENIVVVIDPGHGGENLGGVTERFIEQELTVEVAHFMRERLSMYDGVEIHLTHEEVGEKDLSRANRAEIAAGHNADFMFSLHFNMSENHNIYGAEVWTSAFGEHYLKGREFAAILMDGLVNELGFFDRGIKTRIGRTGDDYYGIISGGREHNIPTVIIEHCHLDQERDYSFLINDENPCKTLGYLDADAVAKYFRLSSAALGVDYSDYDREVFEVSDNAAPDGSEPEYCRVSLLDFDKDNLSAEIEISASDTDSIIQYYAVSYDMGLSYGPMLPWNDDVNANKSSEKERITAAVNLAPGRETSIVVRAYNRYDLYAESEVVPLPAGRSEKERVKAQGEKDEYEEIFFDLSENTENAGNKKPALYGLFLLIICALILTAAFILHRAREVKRKGRKRNRKNI